MNFVSILEKQPIRTLYTISPVSWLGNFGVQVQNSYSKVLWPYKAIFTSSSTTDFEMTGFNYTFTSILIITSK
jgi:hypothetical protein